MTLTEFLLARFDEDEAKAREPWLPLLSDVDAWWSERSADELGVLDEQGDDVKGLAKTLLQIEAARRTHARVLAEVEAKRRIAETHKINVEKDVKRGRFNEETREFETCDYGFCYECDHDRDYGFIGGPDGLNGCPTLRLLALPYADHPDYDPDWRP